MYGKFQDYLKAEIKSIKDAGLYKTERLIATPQDAEIKLTTGDTILQCSSINKKRGMPVISTPDLVRES